MLPFADPKANVLHLGLRDGYRVADLGSGIGHYALAAAPIVGDQGRVYAVDVQQDVLIRLRNEAHERGLKNVEVVRGDLEKPGGTGLRDKTVDAAILSNTLFQVAHKQGAIAEVKRILKPAGKLLVIDWAGPYGGIGPAAGNVLSERDAEELFISAGFHKVKSFRGGAHHYSIVFELP